MTENEVRHDERKKIIAQGCIHTRRRDDRKEERPDLDAWQTAQSEWFDPTILEIVTEYAEWRDAQAVDRIEALEAPLREVDVLDEIAEMMAVYVENWPAPRRLRTAIKLIDKTLAAALQSKGSAA